MMQRRTFIRSVGSILTVLGVSDATWLWGNQRSLSALAQSNPRKFAVLVGINDYKFLPPLRGCVADVSLQRELLVNRFGFERENILEIVNSNATRTGIEAALQEYLPNLVKPGDGVIFHFSGYGTQVKSGGVLETAENALIPIDGDGDGKVSNYLLEDTVLLLLRSLRVQGLAIFDTGYHGIESHPFGGFLSRSVPYRPGINVTDDELALHKSLKNQVLRDTSVITLRASDDRNTTVREVDLPGLTAGAFTYAFTQYFWSHDPAVTVQRCLREVSISLSSLGLGQQPMADDGKKVKLAAVFAEPVLTNISPIGEGVINGIEEDGKTCLVWLGGLPPQVIGLYGVSSLLRVAGGGQGELLQVRSRSGLIAKVQNLNQEKVKVPGLGTIVQEFIRTIPRDINLVVALNSQLERIERVDATSGIASIPRVSAVVTGEQPADWVFGKLEQGSGAKSQYGLFSVDGEPVPNTMGEVGEAVKIATKRLEPKLKALTAAKIWNQTENETSSRLSIKATLEVTNSVAPRAALQRQTQTENKYNNSSPVFESAIKSSVSNLPTIPVGSRIQIRIENGNSQPVYVMLVGLNSNKDAIALFPWQISVDSPTSQSQLQDITIAPNQTDIIPKTPPGFEWTLQGLTAVWELQLLVSTQPWKHTLAALGNENYSPRKSPVVLTLNKPVEISRALLQDIHDASATTSQKYAIASDHYAWDVNCWASFKFTFQVV